MAQTLKTPYEKEKQEFEMKVYRDWQTLTSNPDNKKEAVTAHIMEKYNIHSHTTIWRIRRRVEARLTKGNN